MSWKIKWKATGLEQTPYCSSSSHQPIIVPGFSSKPAPSVEDRLNEINRAVQALQSAKVQEPFGGIETAVRTGV